MDAISAKDAGAKFLMSPITIQVVWIYVDSISRLQFDNVIFFTERMGTSLYRTS
jgi:hypothetical protein